MDFMKRLLVRDPRYRMSTGEALLHPFITGASFMPRYNGLSAAPAGPRGNEMEVDGNSVMKLTSDQCATILESMSVFMRADSLTRLFMEMVSHSLGSHESQQFRDEFRYIDASNTGEVSRKDFYYVFGKCEAAIQYNLDAYQIYDTISLSRKYGKGKDLTFHEYVAAAMHSRVKVTEKRLMLLYSYLDPEQKGQISAQSLRSVLGDDLPLAEAEAMIAAADHDRDLMVSYSDVLALWHSVWGHENGGPGEAYNSYNRYK